MKKFTPIILILCLLIGSLPAVYAQSDAKCDPNADYEALANEAFDADNLEEALAISLCWLEISPDENYALQSTGNAYRRLGEYEESLIYYNRALELYPDDQFALSNRADSYFFLGEYELCIDDATRAVEITPDDVFALELVVACNYWYGDFAPSIEAAESLIGLGEATAFSEMYHAASLFYSFEAERALETIDGAIGLDNGYAFAHTTRAQILSSFEMDDEALEAVNVALSINPDYSRAYAVRGDIYKWLGEYELSIADIEKSLELNPDNIFALESRVLTHFYFGYYADAIEAGEYLLSIYPDNVFVLDRLADSYRVVGLCEDAIAYAERGLEVDPDWRWMIRVKGSCQVSLGDSQAGIDTIMAIAEEDVDNVPFNYNVLVRGYYQLGDYASAVAMGETSTTDNPEFAYSWRLYGVAALANGDIDTASFAFDQFRATETEPDWVLLPIIYQAHIAYLMGADNLDAITEEFHAIAEPINGEGDVAPLDTPTTIALDFNMAGLYWLDNVSAGDSFIIRVVDADDEYYVDPVVVVTNSDGYIVAVGDFGETESDVLMRFTAEVDGSYGVGILADGLNYGTVEFTISAE